MPLYEFICDKCGHEFEELAFGESAMQCPNCGAQDTHKLMSTCARRPRQDGSSGYAPSSGGGCGSCSGGNCASCGH